MSEAVEKTEHEYLHARRFNLRLQVRSNRHYYQQRQHLMELREGMVKVSSLVAGSVVLWNVADPQIIKWAAAVIFAGTAAALVFNWGAKARDSARRLGDWVALERDIDAAGERTFTEQQLDAWNARCNEIESGEPAPHPRLLEACYRKACLSLGSTPTAGGVRFHWLPPVIIP